MIPHIHTFCNLSVYVINIAGPEIVFFLFYKELGFVWLLMQLLQRKIYVVRIKHDACRPSRKCVVSTVG